MPHSKGQRKINGQVKQNMKTFKNEEEIKSFLDKQKLRAFISRRPDLPKNEGRLQASDQKPYEEIKNADECCSVSEHRRLCYRAFSR